MNKRLTKSSLENNAFFTGALWVGILTAISGSLYYVIRELYNLIFRYFVISVTINNKSEAFEWIVRWLGDNKTFLSAQNLTLHVQRANVREHHRRRRGRRSMDLSSKPEVEFLPGPGYHLFMYKGKLFWMHRHQSGRVTTTGWDRRPFIFETLTISTFGRDDSILQELFDEARDACLEKDKGETKVYILDDQGWGSAWTVALVKPPREFSSVILDSDIAEQILSDAQTFLERKQWYREMGLPYRRGYLLYGPPGCGKTSFVTALAGKLKFDICVINLSSNALDDQGLNQRLHDAPQNALLLLEDVDAIFIDRNISDDMRQKRITFSGLLNAIDGVASQEGRLFFMSTNHIEKLDPALIRPGRCDVKVEFKLASKIQMERMFLKFYPNEEKLAKEFVNLIPSNTVSMASLQQHFMKYKNDPKAAVEMTDKILNELDKEEDVVKIDEWLTRLGLSEYIQNFKDQNVYTLEDIKDVDENSLKNDFKIKTVGEITLIMGMLKGRKDIVVDFKLLSTTQIRNLFLEYYNNSNDAEEFMKLVPPNKFSTFQIRKYFDNNKTSKDAINNIEKLLNPTQLIKEKSETYENISLEDWIKNNKFEHIFNQIYKAKKREAPSNEVKNTKTETIEDSVKTLTIYDKMKEEDIVDTDDLIELSESDFIEFGVTKKGTRLLIMESINKLKNLKEKKNEHRENIELIEHREYREQRERRGRGRGRML